MSMLKWSCVQYVFTLWDVQLNGNVAELNQLKKRGGVGLWNTDSMATAHLIHHSLLQATSCQTHQTGKNIPQNLFKNIPKTFGENVLFNTNRSAT